MEIAEEYRVCEYKKAKKLLTENGFVLSKISGQNWAPYEIFPKQKSKDEPALRLGLLHVTRENNGLIELYNWANAETKKEQEKVVKTIRKIQPALEDFV